MIILECRIISQCALHYEKDHLNDCIKQHNKTKHLFLFHYNDLALYDFASYTVSRGARATSLPRYSSEYTAAIVIHQQPTTPTTSYFTGSHNITIHDQWTFPVYSVYRVVIVI
jgi:hypothetical protein